MEKIMNKTNHERELVVVKYGSSCVTKGHRGGVMDNLEANIDWFSAQLAEVHKSYDVLVVTSGAVAVGRSLWPDVQSVEGDENDRFFAASGNPYLMQSWLIRFRHHGIKAGELLLTHSDIDDVKEPDSPGNELRKSLAVIRGLGGIAICNENDPLNTKELAKLKYGGDNDGLASHLAIGLGASALLLMTSTNGVLKPNAARVKHVNPNAQSWSSVKRWAGGPNNNGRGGMKTKVEAAVEAAQHGIAAFIAPGNKSIRSIAEGRYGTYFEPDQAA